MAKMTLDELVAQLDKAFGNDLESVVLYGSAAVGEQIPKRSDYNVLVLVRRLGVEQLRAAAAVARAWGETGNPPPLTLTVDEWRSSADIFPMEYADILERHRVLHGTPPFDGIRVSPRHLRLELEYEAMGKLLRLRQGVLAAGNDRRLQLELLEDSLSPILVIFRSVLRLHGESGAGERESLVARVAGRGEFDPAPFVRVIRHVGGTERIAPADAGAVLARYLEGVEQLVKHLDRFAVA